MASIADDLTLETENLFNRLRPSPFNTNINENSTLQETADSQHIEPTAWINPGSLDGIDLFSGLIRPPVVVTSLPALPDVLYPVGSFAFLTSDAKLYRNTDGSHWSAAVASVDITGHVGIPIAAADPTLPDATYPAGSYYWNSVDKHLRKTTNGTTWILAIEAGDIVANTITAGQIAAGTITATQIAASTILTANLAASVSVQLVSNSGATVVIDASGITITNGKLVLSDQFGSNVLTGAGFGASWLDFISSGFYNGHFQVGTTNNITAATIVGTASTDADYLASLSTNVPYWIVSAESGAGTLKRVADSTAVGGFALQWDGTEDGTVFQDIPVVPGQRYATLLNTRATIPGGAEMDFDSSTQFRKFDHSAIGSEVTEPGSVFANTAAYAVAVQDWTDVAPADARFLRVKLRVYRVSGAPTVWLNGMGAIPTNQLGFLDLYSTMGFRNFLAIGDTQPAAWLSPTYLALGPGGSTVSDVYAQRTAAKTLTLNSDGAGTALTKVSIPGAILAVGGTTVPASPATHDAFFLTTLWTWLKYDNPGPGAHWFEAGVPIAPMTCDLVLPANPVPVAGLLRASIGIGTNWSGYLFAGIFGSVRVTGTNNGTNYWTFQARDQDGNNLGSFSTNGMSANTWTQFTAGAATLLGNTKTQVELVCAAKTGAPGAFHIVGAVHYRGYMT